MESDPIDLTLLIKSVPVSLWLDDFTSDLGQYHRDLTSGNRMPRKVSEYPEIEFFDH